MHDRLHRYLSSCKGEGGLSDDTWGEFHTISDTGNHESAGKRLSGRTGRGNGWLRAVLIEAAWAASRSRGTYLGAQFRRLMRRRGPKKAVLAVAHSILVAVFYILRDGVQYRELGADYFDRLGTTRLLRYHVRRLEELGHRVTLEPVAA